MQNDSVERTAAVDVPVVQTFWEQRVVRLGVRIVWILVATRYRKVQPEPRAEGSAVERVGEHLHMLPSSNRPSTERAKLKRPFQPVLEPAFLVFSAGADCMTHFSIRTLVVPNPLAL